MSSMHPLQKLFQSYARSYSGRGMYGKECLGIDVDGMGEFMSYYTIALRENVDELTSDQWDELEEAIGNVRVDSMGMGQIVYFPGVNFHHGDTD